MVMLFLIAIVGLTPQILQKMTIEYWAKYGCKVPTYYMGSGGNVMVSAPTIK